ncbi:MAG: hypothetical protein AB1916_13035 [Thermodesulfobacteriota bacterium]
MLRTARFCLTALLLLAAACARPAAEAPAPAPIPGPPLPPPPAEAASPGGRPLSLFLADLLAQQHFPASAVYNPPSPELLGSYYTVLRREPATVNLARGVTAWESRGDTLAVGMENGEAHVWSPYSCGRVALPGQGLVSALSWSGESPYLALLDSGRQSVHVFDLSRCGSLAVHAPGGVISRVALSPAGTWLALCDEGHRLWIGPLLGPLAQAAAMRFEVLALAFTPQEGLLMAVDSEGWLTFWAPLQNRLADRALIPGGPFAAATFDGRHVLLASTSGKSVTYDAVRREVLRPRSGDSPFSLRDGVLSYRTARERWTKEVVFGKPRLAVAVSPSLGLARVDDVDGRTRFYALADGAPAPAPAAPARDWRTLDIDPDGRINYESRWLALADPAHSAKGMTLLCRHLPGDGFYLWWRESYRFAEFQARPDALPARRSLLLDSPVEWTPLGPPPSLP